MKKVTQIPSLELTFMNLRLTFGENYVHTNSASSTM